MGEVYSAIVQYQHARRGMSVCEYLHDVFDVETDAVPAGALDEECDDALSDTQALEDPPNQDDVIEIASSADV